MRTIVLKGADALDLLHRISTVNVKSLPLNQPCPALILNAQGKIECAFALSKKSDVEISLTFDEAAKQNEKILSILDQYTFGERYKIETVATEQTQKTITEHQRILSLEPKIGNEFLPDGQTNPLEINLKNSIHDQKGCYPGQEIIEKIVAIGSPAKKLCQLKLVDQKSLTAALPLKLLDSQTQTEVGLLTSIDQDVGLAIVRKTHAKENITLFTPNAVAFKIEKVSS